MKNLKLDVFLKKKEFLKIYFHEEIIFFNVFFVLSHSQTRSTNRIGA